MKGSEPKVSDLRKHIGYWLRVVSNSVSHSFARKLENSGVTVAEWVVLREMYSGDDTTSPSSVADLTGMTRGAISKLLERLLQKGLITRIEAEGDRRFQDIRLTRKAMALVPKLAGLADQNDEEFFSELTAAERKDLLKILKKVVATRNLTKTPIE